MAVAKSIFVINTNLCAVNLIGSFVGESKLQISQRLFGRIAAALYLHTSIVAVHLIGIVATINGGAVCSVSNMVGLYIRPANLAVDNSIAILCNDVKEVFQFCMDYMYISTYAQNGSLADLSEYINNGTIDASGIDEALMNASNIGGKTVGIPLSTSLVAFTYNPSVLEEAGVDVPTDDWTWDDFATAAKTVKEKTGKYGMSTSPVIDTNLFNYWVRGYGEKLFADDNKSLGYDDDKITEDFFTYWLDLIDAGAVPNPDEYEQIATLGNDANPVITNDAAFHQSWNNFTTIGANAGNDTLKLVAPPTNTTNTKALWYKPGMFFSVAETSSVKKEAAEFINWFLNSDEANDIMMGERGTPASATAREHLINSGKLSAQQTDMFNFVDTAAAYCGDTPAADPAGISEINTIFKNIGYAVFYGQTTPADAAAQFRTEVNAVLEANN